MTGENSEYKPGVVEKAKFEFSSLIKVFNKGLDEKGKKEGFLKRLKNIEGKNEEQLKNQLKLVGNDSVNKESFKKLKFLNKRDQDAKESYIKTYHEVKEIDNEIDYNKLVCVHTNGKIYDFTIFRRLGDLARNIYYGDISIKQAKSR